MKKIISAITFAILLSSMLPGNTHGQFASMYAAVSSVTSDPPASTNPSRSAKAARKTEMASARAEKSFKKNFNTNADVNWFREDKLILATFKEDGVTTRITYRNTGTWFRTIKSYQESKLKESVKTLINENYEGYAIKVVSEVNEGDLHCYFINVQKEKDFKQLLVYDGNVHIYKEFKLQ
ncbi:hypothetical protein ACX0G7_10560 [Flavitalea antarctica]